jgi:hypothetical protein
MWKAGEQVICDRSDTTLSDCFIRSIDSDSVVIFCPSRNTVVCGRWQNLKQFGWHTVTPEQLPSNTQN